MTAIERQLSYALFVYNKARRYFEVLEGYYIDQISHFILFQSYYEKHKSTLDTVYISSHLNLTPSASRNHTRSESRSAFQILTRQVQVQLKHCCNFHKKHTSSESIVAALSPLSDLLHRGLETLGSLRISHSNSLTDLPVFMRGIVGVMSVDLHAARRCKGCMRCKVVFEKHADVIHRLLHSRI